MSLSERQSGHQNGPQVACRQSQIRHRAKDRLVIIRREYVEICDGNHVAAALLNEAEFIADNRLSAGEPEWFQRKSSYWVSALQGLASERTIREAFRTIKELGLMDFKQANGDKAGAWFRLEVESVQAAIEKLDEDDPGKEDPASPAELPTTPANESGDPGKNDRGKHLLYTRAGEPSLEPLQEPSQQQQADLGGTDSGSNPQPPPAADGFPLTLDALKARAFTTCRRGEKWEQRAKASGFSDTQLAGAINAPEFDASNARTPVLLIDRACDAVAVAERERQQNEPEKPRFDWTGASVGPKPAGFRCVCNPPPKDCCKCSSTCDDLFVFKARTPDGERVTLCAYCHEKHAPDRLIRTYRKAIGLEQKGYSMAAIRARLGAVKSSSEPEQVTAGDLDDLLRGIKPEEEPTQAAA